MDRMIYTALNALAAQHWAEDVEPEQIYRWDREDRLVSGTRAGAGVCFGNVIEISTDQN